MFTSASPLFENEDCLLHQEKLEETIWKRTLPVPTTTAGRSLQAVRTHYLSLKHSSAREHRVLAELWFKQGQKIQYEVWCSPSSKKQEGLNYMHITYKPSTVPNHKSLGRNFPTLRTQLFQMFSFTILLQKELQNNVFTFENLKKPATHKKHELTQLACSPILFQAV